MLFSLLSAGVNDPYGASMNLRLQTRIFRLLQPVIGTIHGNFQEAAGIIAHAS